jgi:hypothetical protein
LGGGVDEVVRVVVELFLQLSGDLEAVELLLDHFLELAMDV